MTRTMRITNKVDAYWREAGMKGTARGDDPEVSLTDCMHATGCSRPHASKRRQAYKASRKATVDQPEAPAAEPVNGTTQQQEAPAGDKGHSFDDLYPSVDQPEQRAKATGKPAPLTGNGEPAKPVNGTPVQQGSRELGNGQVRRWRLKL